MSNQDGYIYKAFGAFHVRYYATELVDGKLKKVQKSKKLCTKSASGRRDYTRTSKAVTKACKDFMRTINEREDSRAGAGEHDATVVEFYDSTYLPFATENLKPSSLYSLKQIWNQHLKTHFGKLALKEYRTHMGSQLLTFLAKTLGRNTLQHVRSTASGIFSHALNVGLIESNPWHDVKVLGKTRAPGQTAHYTLEELENIISAMVDRVDCQLVVALAGFLGLRPGEIAALRWEDFDQQWIHIRRAVGRGVVGTPKTASSVASLPLIAPVRVPLELWRAKCADVTEGWTFPGRFSDRPGDLKARTRVIESTLKTKNIPWKTLYAGRRGAATILTELTGDALAAKELLRHKNLAVTPANYVKAIPEAMLKGLRLLEAASASERR